MTKEQLSRLRIYLELKLHELLSEEGEFELGQWSAYEHIEKVIWLMMGEFDGE